ncbi:hypothetical protein L0Y65_00800 [Candidatus Micrarchaeota archaeon]|nr:hypothetical protein [Candidatus Micrarchaeota archaeon]
MKILYAYFSRTGNNAILAKEICKSLDCTLERIEADADLLSMFTMMRLAIGALLGIMPRIKEPKENPSEYDLLIIGTPAWAGEFPSPAKAYLRKKKGNVKRYAIASLSGSGNNPKMLGQIRQVMGAEPAAVMEIGMPKTEKPSMDAVIGADYLQNECGREIEEFITKIRGGEKRPGQGAPAERRAGPKSNARDKAVRKG